MSVKQLSPLERFSAQRSCLAEGPCWSERDNGLYWVDIPNKKLYFSPIGGPVSSWSFKQKISAVVEAIQGGLILALAKNIIHFDPTTNHITKLFKVDEDIPSNRSNDAKCDPWGNLWVGTMDDNETETSGRLHVLSAEGEHKILLENIGISNTLAWDIKQQIVYFADSMAGEIYKFPIKQSNSLPSIGERRLFSKEPSGSPQAPDGSTIDCDGFLWNAKWGGSKVVRYSQMGEVDFTLDVPAGNVTSCCFGGPENKILFITTALNNPDNSIQEATENSGDGYIYSIEMSVKGAPTYKFGDKSPRSFISKTHV